MAKQIKLIQCPQCGSTKPEQIEPDIYRCDKCGTRFFLDNDDININVNHNIPRDEEGSRLSTSGCLWYFIAIALSTTVIVLIQYCSSTAFKYTDDVTTTYKTYGTQRSERNKYLFSTLLPAGGKGIALYVENRGAEDSTTVIFRDVVNERVLNQQNIGRKINVDGQVAHRFFTCDSTNYLILNRDRIYRVDVGKHTLTDITEDICAKKPALEAGIMSVDFVDKGTGEGFRMYTNLGKELFYFPAADVLCTEKAYKFMATGPKGILPGAENRIYYLFLNRESSHSSNAARLMEITYLFNNGGPENKLLEITGGGIGNLQQHRIVSSKAITDEQACFSPTVLYSDDRNILVSFRPTLAPDAVVNVRLLDASGNIIWTVAFTSDFGCTQTIRTQSGYLLQTSENNFWEVSSDAGNVKNYNF